MSHAKRNDDGSSSPEIPNFLQLPTHALLDEFGAGRHKPGSGSAAALHGLVACKMMQTVITVTRRNASYAQNISQLNFVGQALLTRNESFFRDAVQKDSEQFDRYHKAVMLKRAATDATERRYLADNARNELIPATEIPLDIARHGLETAERGMVVYDLGVRHARGDSGVAVSAALSSCSGALFIVYLNLLQFREGVWARTTRATADSIAERFQALQFEQFRRVVRIQAEGVEVPQPELQLGLETTEDEAVL
jgi:formiminotetrahydrofolate cyclodeaminase